MSRVQVKVCGITRPDQAGEIAGLGVAAIGLVFVPESPRYVSPQQALDIVNAVPPLVHTVGLFLDAPKALVEQILAQVPLSLLQFHGSESPAYCRHFARPYWKAIAMGDEPNLIAVARRYHDARGLLLDAHRAGELGGTGRAFEWDPVALGSNSALILAGGLNPDNVAHAIRRMAPAAVDVSSGVEHRPGVKDIDKVRRFLSEVERAAS